jgi:hypothetical protein
MNFYYIYFLKNKKIYEIIKLNIKFIYLLCKYKIKIRNKFKNIGIKKLST